MNNLYKTYCSAVIPRPYQEAIVDSFCKEPKSCLIKLNKGMGKSYLPAWIFYRLKDDNYFGKESKGLILVQNQQLLNQWKGFLTDLGVKPENVYVNRSLNFWRSVSNNKSYINHSSQNIARVVNSCTRDVWNKAEWLISTPQTFSKDVYFLKTVEGGSDVIDRYKLIVLDEVQDALAIATGSDDEVFKFHRVNFKYSGVFDFLKKSENNPLIIGLSGGFDSVERQQALSHFFRISPLEYNKDSIDSWKFNVRYHKILVKDEYISNISQGVDTLRAETVQRLSTLSGIDPKSKSFYSDLAELLKGEQDNYSYARQCAWFTLSLDVLKLHLYDHSSYNQCYDEIIKTIDKVPDSKMNQENINEIRNLAYSRLIQGDLSAKVKALINILNSKDLNNEGIVKDELGILKPVNENAQTLVFCRTRASAKNISRILKFKGLDADYVIGTGLGEDLKTERVNKFKKGELKILVTTDKYLGVGLDFPNIDYTIDFSSSSNPGYWSQRAFRMRGGDFFSMLYDSTSELARLEHIRHELERQRIDEESLTSILEKI